ncbi:MAG: tetratricopeptide repeat protein [Planctomycetes bacterium]|nr:tetratricopeptide repeat protein [Planctomycetota bacterium]
MLVAGKIREASDKARESYAWARDHLEEGDPMIATAGSTHAALLLELGEVSEAEGAFEEVRRLLTMGATPDAAEMARCLSGLGACRAMQERPEEALKLSDDAESYLQSAGARPDIAGGVQIVRARALIALGRWEEARAASQRASDDFEKVGNLFGHWAALTLLAGCLRLLGRTAEAEAPLKKALESVASVKEQFPELHAAALNNLGEALLQTGHPDRAMPYFQRALQILEEKRGPCDLSVVTVLSNLGLAYQGLGEFVMALEKHQRTLELRERLLKEDDAQIAASYSNLASVYMALRDFDKAQSAFERAVKILDQGNPNDLSLATALNNLAVCYLEKLRNDPSAGTTAQAHETLAHAIRIYEATLGPEHLNTVTANYNLCELLLREGRSSDAIPMLQAAVREFYRIFGKQNPWVAAAYCRLGRAEAATGDLKAAEAALQEAHGIYEAAEAKDPNTAECLTALADVYHRLGCPADAIRSLLVKAADVLAEVFGAQDPRTQEARQRAEGQA